MEGKERQGEKIDVKREEKKRAEGKKGEAFKKAVKKTNFGFDRLLTKVSAVVIQWGTRNKGNTPNLSPL